MPIATVDAIAQGLAQTNQRLNINKNSLPNQLPGGATSLWRATGTPGQGAIPPTSPVQYHTKNDVGAFSFNNPTAPAESYLARMFAISLNSGTDIQIHDRLASMGSLAANATSNWNVFIDMANVVNQDRLGDPAYTDVQWWLEWYADTGATAVTATVTYTNAAGTPNRTTTVAVGSTTRAARMLPIIGAGGEFIKSVENVQLSASTGVAGSFGVTATRGYTSMSLGLANSGVVYDWQQLGLPNISNDACLQIVVFPGTTSSGSLIGSIAMIQA